MEVDATTPDALPDDLVAVGLFVRAGDGGPELIEARPEAALDAELPDELDAQWCTRQGFTGKVGQTLVLRAAGRRAVTVLLGLGDPERAGAEAWRKAGAAMVRQAGDGGTAAVLVPATPPGADPASVAAALAEGAGMAAYRFTPYRSSPGPAPLDRLLVVADAVDDGVADGVARGRRVAAAVCAARDLANTPPSDLNPAELASRATELLADRSDVTVEVWDEARLEAERMNGLLSVGRGSAHPPRLVRADYRPAGADDAPLVILVGKGITFDSGGLSLKTADGMVSMKTDMSGAACVLTTLAAAADLGVPVRVTALAAMSENMPGPDAMKPGDVLTTRSGQTVEVLNTDAEGRLVLSDALTLASELEPDAIIDVATLTGAAAVALGNGVAPVFSNRDALVAALRAAGGRAGERLWPFPMPDDYRDHIESDVADMKNTGRAGQAGAISAAMLLARFVGDTPWAHLDIAGTGRSAESAGYLSKGGTGFAVRTLIEFLRTYEGLPATDG
jgi:leucyl aminopeptidase